MFKRNDNLQPFAEEPTETMETSMPQQPVQTVAAIGPSIIVRGDITGDEDLLIQGRVEGQLDLPKNDVTVGPDGKVKADLKALKIVVHGEVIGDLRGTEKVVVKRSGKVAGNIAAPRVVLEDGCRFKGSVDMDIEADQKTATVKQTPDKAKAASGNKDTGPLTVASVARASSGG